jgi:hypothetical protein
MSSTVEKAIESVERENYARFAPQPSHTTLIALPSLEDLMEALHAARAIKQQLLSIGQEEMLIIWILEQERLGHAPTH